MSNQIFLKLRFVVVLTAALAASTGLADVAPNTDAIATRHQVSTSAGQDIPAGAFGFLLVERPREVNLLALRGIAGSGKAILRTDQPGLCLNIPVRFVAGDLGGQSINGHLADPIHFVITSRQVARSIAKGRDVVSDMYSVSDQIGSDADIVLQSGLDAGFGFVINPGRNILGDIFGVRARPVSCQRV
ncbi:MAG: hypothetical protein WBC93_07650 [Sulfitobacter sp.]